MEPKLYLQSEMGRSYLIQRLRQPQSIKVGGKEVDDPFSFGGGLVNGGISKDAMKQFRYIFSFDYMGAAEFEWGAVPNALTFLAEQASQKKVAFGQMNLGERGSGVVYFVCPESYTSEVKKRIAGLYRMDGSVQPREHCGLKEYFKGKSEYDKHNVGWLELNNGFAFFVDKVMFEKFCKLFGLNEEE